MVSKTKWLYLSVLALIAAIFGLVHQKLFTPGGWFNWKQFSHHEPLIAIAMIVGVTLLIVYLSERWQTKSNEKQNSK